MKARIFRLESAEHLRAQELLPWFVSGTLAETERAQVASHLDACVRCQNDAAEIASLRSLPPEPVSSKDLERGWSALLRRVCAAPAVFLGGAAMARSVSNRRLQIAVVVQAAIILVLIVTLLWGSLPRSEPYRTLGASSGPLEANAVVTFEPTATQAQIADALRAAHARIVGGPTKTGAYLLHLDSPAVGALGRLRAHPDVLNALSLDAEGGR